jgi:hypothetical protein
MYKFIVIEGELTLIFGLSKELHLNKLKIKINVQKW